jgi:hypothetical protein
MKTNLTTGLSALCAVLLIVLLVLQAKQKSQLETFLQEHEGFAQATAQQLKMLQDSSDKMAGFFAEALQKQQDALAKADEQQQQTLTNVASAIADSSDQQGKILHATADSLNKQFAAWTTNVDDRLTKDEQEAKENAALVGNMVQQNTAVMHRALGKVIPVELPEALTNQLAVLEARIADENSWPKDSTNTDAMVAELRGLIRQIPPWAEEDYLPRLNALRWAVHSLELIQSNVNAQGEDLNSAADAYANQLSIQPDGGAANIAAALTSRQQDATARFAAFRLESAIIDATNQLNLAVMDNGLSAWQNLAEWTNDPTVGSNALELRQQLHARLLDDEIASYSDTTKVELGKLDAVTNNALRQAGYLRALENVTVQRLSLLQEADAPPSTVNALADLSMTIETRIKDNERGYQQWALEQISNFRAEFDTATKRTKPGAVFGSNPNPDYEGVANAIVGHLIPISPAYLDSAVAMIYRQAFDEGMNKLENDKYYQTDVAEKDAITPKKTPQNYLEN